MKSVLSGQDEGQHNILRILQICHDKKCDLKLSLKFTSYTI